jgi:hypothetical protein
MSTLPTKNSQEERANRFAITGVVALCFNERVLEQSGARRAPTRDRDTRGWTVMLD